ncbi:MAG: hypothetical protein KBC90_02335 [Spirochaetes bacterium]|nr:hypothetical protein [Spirochaetota bacterium]HOD15164.1 hypothetical protein [Spirochaetota bacterium]
MKINLFVFIIAAVVVLSCSSFKKAILIDGVVEEKARIEATDNPAMKSLIRDELGKRRIELVGLTVKDVVDSGNIDYDFCVIADVQTQKGMVQCHIYTTDVKTVAKLVKGKSIIDVSGDFGRFFSLLDSYYTRLEVVKASIRIKG